MLPFVFATNIYPCVYNIEMMGRQIKYSILIIFCFLLLVSVTWAESRIGDSVVYDISVDVFENNFESALGAVENMISNEPENPLGYFLAGAIYQIISEKFRNDTFEKQIEDNLDRAIELCDDRIDDSPDNPDWRFIIGASYGYRGLHRALHGGWWGAFRDGMKCKSNLLETLKLDSTYYDAYLGLGSYYYYRTIKAKDFLWLPFISDNREKGMSQIRIAIKSGNLAPNIARQAFLRIFYLEKRFDELLVLADSLYLVDSSDAYTLLYYVKGLIAVDSLKQAQIKLERLKEAWENSPYFDSIGFYEIEYLLAAIAYHKGDKKVVQDYIGRILKHQSWRRKNAYFNETYERAKWLSEQID